MITRFGQLLLRNQGQNYYNGTQSICVMNYRSSKEMYMSLFTYK